jgi:tyrosinase
MHHANVDRIWWEWQSRDLERRVREMTGPLRPRTDIFRGSNYTDFPQKNITMDWELDLGRLAPKVKTREIMHIQRGILNYRYTNPRKKYVDGVPWPFEEEQSEEHKQEFEKEVKMYERMWARFKKATWAPGAGGNNGVIL